MIGINKYLKSCRCIVTTFVSEPPKDPQSLAVSLPFREAVALEQVENMSVCVFCVGVSFTINTPIFRPKGALGQGQPK